MEIWSFFTGAMGLDLGLEKAGLAPTLANEIDPRFCETVRLNRPHLPLINADISNLTFDNLRATRKLSKKKADVLLMVGGPPCQSFSSGGKRESLTDPRGSLIYQYFRLVAAARPRYFVLENVANLVTAALKHRPIASRPGQHWSLKRYDTDWQSGDGQFDALTEDERSSTVIRQILRDIELLGYTIQFGILDAADFGAAQHRLRFVMFGARDGDCPRLPEPTHGPLSRTKQPYRTVRDEIWSLRRSPGPHSEYTPNVKRVFEKVPEGGNWRSLPLKLQMKALGGSFYAGGGKTGFYRRLAWGNPSPTITGRANRKGSALCHPQFDRPLSVRECAAIQGFPRTWNFYGAMNTQYLQVGNAVPIKLGEAIGRAIAGHLKNPLPASDASIDEMLQNAVERLRKAACNKKARARQIQFIQAAE